MSLRKLNSIFMLAAIALAAIGCKEDDDEVDLIYLDGNLTFTLPEFVTPGQVLTFKPEGMTHPDDGEIGYCWKITPSMTQFDTTRFLTGLNKDGVPSDGSFTHTFSDTLQTYTVYCYAFAEGYSASSKTNYTTAVSPGLDESITGSGIFAKDPSISVNGNVMYYTTIGQLDWLRQNMAFTDGGVPFRNSEPMDGVFGRYYSYEDALKACPQGWRLPTCKDWEDLGRILTGNTEEDYLHGTIPGIAGKLMANAYFNEIKMWEYWPSVGQLTNDIGLSLIPTGYANLGNKDNEGRYPESKFTGVYEYAVVWTADKDDDGMAYYRYIYCDRPDFQIGKGDTDTFGAAVRCVRDITE